MTRYCADALEANSPVISIDHAVMERSDRIVLCPARFDWDDIGSWPALIKFFYKRLFRFKFSS